MSRNLCKRCCDFCEGVVKLTESPRPITEADAGRYYSACHDLVVAHAVCVDCEAKYLAWVTGKYWPPHFDSEGNPAPSDLSFRSSFNDEPGPDDMPKWKMGRVRIGPWGDEPTTPRPAAEGDE